MYYTLTLSVFYYLKSDKSLLKFKYTNTHYTKCLDYYYFIQSLRCEKCVKFDC